MKKYFEYIPVFIFLIGVILLNWYLFFYLELISSNEKRLTGVFSLLGLGFGLFQFWFNEIKAERRKKFDLRFNAYQEIVILIESIVETINNQMTSNEILEVHGLVSKLMNQVNRIILIMNINNDYLFPGIHNAPESKKNHEIFKKILLRTDQYRIGIEKAAKGSNKIAKDFIESVEAMNWHNDMREFLDELHGNKYDFYKKLRTYL
jgi:hypothetical protein